MGYGSTIRTVNSYKRNLPVNCKPYSQVIQERNNEFFAQLAKENRPKSRFARALLDMKSKIKSEFKGRNSRKSNPINSESEDLEGIEGMSRSFHGREPKDTYDVVEKVEYEDRLAILADLIELGVLSCDGKSILTICFVKDKPKLTCNAEGTNLELVGGDQKLNIKNSDSGKDLQSLGFCVSIAYETDKHHLEDSNGRKEAYEHYFAEEWYKEHGYSNDKFFESALGDGIVSKAAKKGLLPTLIYDCRNERILFAGGVYEVKDVGIKN